jgi:hypothetical protein
MGLAQPDYAPLDRRFDRAAIRDTFDYWAEILADGDKPRDWSWLRAQSRIVALLAQAGSGKTVEFQHQVDEARKSGRDVFFFRVERLCTGILDDAHETPECKARFDRWLAGNGQANIFLDSVDEAKLPQSRTAKPLRDAIGTLRRVIEPHLARTAIFVSCRSSEWFDDIEQRALEELAEAVSAKSAAPEPIQVFNATFAPLDLARVRLLAEARGAAGAVDVLIESEAIADIVTPLDAILYIDAWREFNGTDDLRARFASRSVLLETSVRRRLSEEGGQARRSQLEFSSALRAGQFLAFASVTAQTMDIAVGGPRKDCIDPNELLAGGHAGLSPDSIRQLLACSLFVPAGQARVRFYRSEARAMLAAQWLRDRIGEGASPLKVTDRFIPTIYGRERVPGTYGSMLAWLASYDPVILRRMIQAAPEWIIEDGDPRSLALEDRITALKQQVALGPNRFAGEFRFDVSELRRFAKPELEEVVVTELAKLPPDDLLEQIMQVCEAGRYQSAAPHLVAIVLDFKRSAGDRMDAMRALLVCGDSADLRRVALRYISTGGPSQTTPAETFAVGRSDMLLLDLVTGAYPTTINAAEALALLGQLQGRDHGFVAKSFARWTASIPDADLAAWWIGLDRLCFQKASKQYNPFGYDMPKMRRRATILLRGFSEIAARYVSSTGPFDFDRDLLIYDRVRHIRNVGADYSVSRRGSPLPAALARNVALRIALYERLAMVEARRGTAFAYHEHLWDPAYHGKALDEDLAWLLQRYRAAEGEARDDYAETYLLLTQRYGATGRKRRPLARAALWQRRPDWGTAKEALITPIIAPWRRYRMRRRQRRHDPNYGLRALRERVARKYKLGATIVRNWRGLANGTAIRLLAQLVLDNGYQSPSEAELKQRFGTYFGGRLIEGVKAYTRAHHPVDRGRSVYSSDILATLGLDFIWNSDRSMTGVDPGAALRSALFHTTDWPEWATDLALRHPATWIEVAIPLVVNELAQAPLRDVDLPGRFLSTIAYLEDDVRAILSGPLFEWVKAERVIDTIDLERVGRVLRADCVTEAQLPNLASLRARESWYEGGEKRAMSWLPFWLPKGEDGLRTLLGWMDADPGLVEDGLNLYVRYYGERSDGAKLDLPALDIRYRFAVFAYDLINPKDDAPTPEGIHTPTARHELQHLRSSVGELLSASYDAAERAALERLLQTYIEPVSLSWADRWRNRYEKGAAKPAAWSHSQIVAVGRDLTAAPSSGQTLLERVAELVADLEAELATSEFDRRGLFSPSILEADFRSWLGHALDGRRRPWFSIVQEAETAAEARTDLRLEQRETGDAMVIIEIKLAHRWSYEELLDKFRSQLIDRYLLGGRVRHGLYVLVDLGKLPKKAMPDGSQPDVATLASILNAQASGMRASGGPVAITQVFTVSPSKRHVRRQKKAAGGKPFAAKRAPKGR